VEALELLIVVLLVLAALAVEVLLLPQGCQRREQQVKVMLAVTTLAEMLHFMPVLAVAARVVLE
jgi:hypothetical protein